MRRTRLTIAAALVASAGFVGVPTAASAAPASTPADVPVQLLTINDFHGRISNTSSPDSQVRLGPGPNGTFDPAPTATVPQDDEYVTVGGAANVASAVTATRDAFVASGGAAANSLFIGLGDLVGASPFDSASFRDESTVEVLNSLDMAVSVVGNHEFDRGTDELYRLSGATDDQASDDIGACERPFADGACFRDSTGNLFTGTDFPYLAANVVDRTTGEPALPPYAIQEVGGQRIGFIGVVTETTAGIVAPTGIADVEFIDEADAINEWAPVLQAEGVEAIVALVHEGGTNTGADATSINGCDQITGSIVDINERTDPAVDVVLSAHTHQNYSCYLTDPAGQPRLVAQSGFYGRLVGDVRFVIDGATGDVDRLCGTYSVTNVPTDRNARPADAATQRIVDYWAAQARTTGSATVGNTRDPLARPRLNGSEDRGTESQLGNTVAESQLEFLQSDPQGTYDGDSTDFAGGVPAVAFMNPGGLRADINAGEVTYREVFDVQPFGNYANAITLTGADIKLLLEQQFATPARARQLALGTSEGFSYTYDLSRSAYDRVDPASITIVDPTTGIETDLDPAVRYRVVANSFLAGGGDSFSAFTAGLDQVTGPVDVDTFIAFLDGTTAANPYVAPPADHGTAVSGSTDPVNPAFFAPTPSTPPAGGGTAGGNGSDAVVDGITGTTGTAAAGYPCPAQSDPGAGEDPGTPGAPGTQPIANPGNGIAAGQLANTGAATGQLTALGVGLLLAGGAATAAGYRRGRGVTE